MVVALLIATALTIPTAACRQGPQAPAGALPSRPSWSFDELVGFVEQQRGAPFDQSRLPRFTPLAAVDFDERMAGTFADQAAGLGGPAEQLLAGASLTKPGVDVPGELRRALSAGTVGWYHDGELLVRGTDLDPYTASIVVHELTHALDDQRFEVFAHRPSSAESAAAWTALTEGSAKRVELAFVDQLDAGQRGQYQSAVDDRERRLSGIDPAIRAALDAPYELGAAYVSSLFASGGNEAIDRAFTSPPITTAQLLGSEGQPSASPAVGQPFGSMWVWIAAWTLGVQLPPAVIAEWGAGSWATGKQDCVEVTLGPTAAPTQGADIEGLLDAWAARPGMHRRPDFAVSSCP